MDYRYRDYYLASIDCISYDMRMGYFKIAAPSLKVHASYNHIKNSNSADVIDGMRWQMMLSCRKEDSEALEYELRKAVRNDKYGSIYSYGSRFVKLSKEICGQ